MKWFIYKVGPTGERHLVMKFKTILIISLLFCIFVTPSWSRERKPKLVLLKRIADPITMHMQGRLCNRVLVIEKDNDIVAASNMRNRFCEGEYSLSLYGPPGTTVTIYGQYFYGKTRGYLTLTKTDYQKVQIGDFKNFPDKRWIVTMPNQKTGGYESFFQPGPGFSRNFSSIKWNEIP